MGDPVRIDIFAEDYAHEQFVRALVHRVCAKRNLSLSLKVISAKGGHPQMMNEFAAYQKAVQKGQVLLEKPDLLVVVRDSNCSPYSQVYKEIDGAIHKQVFPYYAIACPNPHVERWFMADPESFQKITGADCQMGKTKCNRELYKRKFIEEIRAGGNPILFGGAEYASDIVREMNLYRAEKNETSFHHFLENFTKSLSQCIDTK